MMDFSIFEKNSNKYVLTVYDGTTYDLLHDPATGDWIVTSDDDTQVQGDWMLTKEDALKHALRSAGILENVNVDRAPERC